MMNVGQVFNLSRQDEILSYHYAYRIADPSSLEGSGHRRAALVGDRRIFQRARNTTTVELAQRAKLRGFGTFVVLRFWEILQSLRLLQDDNCSFAQSFPFVS